MDDIITTLATLYTQCEQQGIQCKASLYWVDKHDMMQLAEKNKKSTYQEIPNQEDRERVIDCANANIHFGFGEVLFFDKQP